MTSLTGIPSISMPMVFKLPGQPPIKTTFLILPFSMSNVIFFVQTPLGIYVINEVHSAATETKSRQIK